MKMMLQKTQLESGGGAEAKSEKKCAFSEINIYDSVECNQKEISLKPSLEGKND